MKTPKALYKLIDLAFLIDVLICIVCRKKRHHKNCSNPCYLCESTDHSNSRCSLACGCNYFADHQKINCTMPCLQCGEGDPDHVEGQPNKAMHCAKACVVCGETHNTLEGPTPVMSSAAHELCILAVTPTWRAILVTHASSPIAAG